MDATVSHLLQQFQPADPNAQIPHMLNKRPVSFLVGIDSGTLFKKKNAIRNVRQPSLPFAIFASHPGRPNLDAYE
jgi:hypothetical protein